MTKLTHFMIHCSATKEGVEYKAESILHWHLLPAVQPDGKLKYKGIIYQNTEELPDEIIGGLSVKKYRGDRGWRAPGYSDVILLDGSIQNIYKYNDDDNVDGFEITNGILASSSLYRSTRHVCYFGGLDKNNQPKDTRTEGQKEALKKWVFDIIKKYPKIKGIGHNQIDPRSCPSFNVPQWLRSIGVMEDNIDNRPLLFKIK